MKIVNKSAFVMAQYHAGKSGRSTCAEQWKLAMNLLRVAYGMNYINNQIDNYAAELDRADWIAERVIDLMIDGYAYDIAMTAAKKEYDEQPDICASDERIL